MWLLWITDPVYLHFSYWGSRSGAIVVCRLQLFLEYMSALVLMMPLVLIISH